MPKTNNDITSKSKSTRKPLRDVSNGGVKPSSKSVKKKPIVMEDRGGDDALDHLLHVHSDMSSLINQIDELVVQALKIKVTSDKRKKEIDSFAHVLSEMQNSLKSWVPRLQKVLSSRDLMAENQLEQPVATNRTLPSLNEEPSDIVDNPDQTKLDSLVSLSPLVSRHGDCPVERGRQLFLFTPLPKPKAFTSKFGGSSKSVYEKLTPNTTVGLTAPFAISGDTYDDLLEGVAVNPTPSKVSDSVLTNTESSLNSSSVSPAKFSKRECSMLVMTPCMKMSPPKSCILLEPVSEFSHKNNHALHKSTPFPVGVQNFSGSQDSESAGSKVTERQDLKYSELFGMRTAHKSGNRRKVVEESPNWLMSPPKTCVLMELSGEKSSTDAATNCQLLETESFNQQTKLCLMKNNDIQRRHLPTKMSSNQELGGISALIESTPMWKEPESTIQMGKHPGEITLKKELWTKFEAASTNGICFNAPFLQEAAQKGFLDRLDEVSCGERVPLPEGLR